MPENNRCSPVAPGNRSNGTWLGMTSAMKTVRNPLPIPMKQKMGMVTAYEEQTVSTDDGKGENFKINIKRK